MAEPDGRVTLVTGGAAGIGLATAARLAAAGGRVAIVDRDAEAVARAAAGTGLLPLAGDVGDEAAVESFFATTVERFGRIDQVFNNAGIAGVTKPLTEITLDDYEQMYRVCERGVFLVLRAAMRQMLAQGTGGSIVNTTSSAGLRGREQRAHYCAAKHAVVGLTRAAALEGGAHGIRVNAIAPGPIETGLVTSVVDSWGEGDRERGRAAMLGRVPLGRIGQPHEAAALVCWLLSEQAGFVTGGIYPIDGGATAA